MNPGLSRLTRLALAGTLVLAGASAPARAESAATRERHAREAVAHEQRALSLLARRTVETRRMAIAELERATELAPERMETQLTLARTYFAAGFLRLGRERFERVAAASPNDAGAQLGLGQVWRRDWLKYQDSTSLVRAVGHLERATRSDTALTDGWLLLSSLRIEQGDLDGAATAAQRAEQLAPGRPDPLLALGSTRWRQGDVAGAERAFRTAMPRLPRVVRERFEDIAPVASEQDTLVYNHLPVPQQLVWAARFWREHDPDPTSPENEAQLEYWARVAQAYFLYFDAHRSEWDERGEVYVRYGPPPSVEYNPIGSTLSTTIGQDSRMRYPMNLLVWSYPALGMTVTLQDRLLSEYYQLPITFDHDPDPRPDPEALARLDALGTHDLRGVFPTLPPRAQPVHIDTQIACFPGEADGRVYAALEAATGPDDSLHAEFVVLDTAQVVLRRTRTGLAPSACDPGRYRVADFADHLAPGHYTLGLSVRAGNRRGAARLPFDVPRPPESLALSDVVVTCGRPYVGGPVVRLDPNPRARVGPGDALTVYFEIDHLTPDAQGEGRFEYDYRVVSLEREARPWIQRLLSGHAAPSGPEVSRMEVNVGPLRRQFVTVPLGGLPAGRYRFLVEVRDLVSDARARGHADFVLAAADPPPAPAAATGSRAAQASGR